MNWIVSNYIEIVGALLGLLFLYFEIKESVLLWPLGIATSLFYVFIFFGAKFYADMGLQFYYIFISIYGWVYWVRRKTSTNKQPSINRLKMNVALWLFVVSVAIYYPLGYLLDNFTDSPLPYWDAFTTALSIVATWMLARKILEQWLVWVLVDAVSMVLYLIKGLYPTTALFAVYTVLAIFGYIQWRNSWKKTEQAQLIGIGK